MNRFESEIRDFPLHEGTSWWEHLQEPTGLLAFKRIVHGFLKFLFNRILKCQSIGTQQRKATSSNQ